MVNTAVTGSNISVMRDLEPPIARLINTCKNALFFYRQNGKITWRMLGNFMFSFEHCCEKKKLVQ